MFIVVHQITFQVKRVRKAKADGMEGAASSDDSLNGESPGGHSVLEISGPTIPSPGPSGNAYRCILHRKGLSSYFPQHGELVLCICVYGQVAGGTTQVLVGLGQRNASEQDGWTSPL